MNIDGIHISDVNAISSYLQHKVDMRKDWVRRFKKFAINYFNGNEQLCANCLKHVNIFHTWQKLRTKNQSSGNLLDGNMRLEMQVVM